MAEEFVRLSDHARLTVAVPTYNGSRYVKQALHGILAQEGIGFDLVVSDDRSDDATVDLVRTVAGDRARIVVNSERLGLAGNWNRCVELAQTPHIAIFHQDDVMRPGHLLAHSRAFDAHPGLGFVASASEVIGPGGEPLSEDVVARGGLGAEDAFFPAGALLPRLAGSNPLRCSSVTIVKEAHTDVRGFDPSYRYVVDWHFWIRVAARWPVMWLATPTVGVRWHSASETHRFKTGTDDLDESARLVNDFGTLTGTALADAVALRKTADRSLARAFLNRAYDASRSGDRQLTRNCLQRAFRLAPGLVSREMLDARLTLRLAWSVLAPGRRPRDSGGGRDAK